MRTIASDKKLVKTLQTDIRKIEGETKLVGWKNKRSTEKRLNILIYDILRVSE